MHDTGNYLDMKYAHEFFPEGHVTGRSHADFVAVEYGVLPGVIRYGWHKAPCGEILVALSERGICQIGFAVDGEREQALSRMRTKWSEARLTQDRAGTAESAEQVLYMWELCRASSPRMDVSLTLHLNGTDFQLQVWRELLKIPCGTTVSYGDIAGRIGKEKACRAVGSAVAANHVPPVVPCHRVVQASGRVNNFGWGNDLKKRLLAIEAGIL